MANLYLRDEEKWRYESLCLRSLHIAYTVFAPFLASSPFLSLHSILLLLCTAQSNLSACFISSARFRLITQTSSGSFDNMAKATYFILNLQGKVTVHLGCDQQNTPTKHNVQEMPKILRNVENV